LSSVVVAWRHCTDITRRVECADPLAETHRRDRCTTAALLTIDVNKQGMKVFGALGYMGPLVVLLLPLGVRGITLEKS